MIYVKIIKLHALRNQVYKILKTNIEYCFYIQYFASFDFKSAE